MDSRFKKDLNQKADDDKSLALAFTKFCFERHTIQFEHKESFFFFCSSYMYNDILDAKDANAQKQQAQNPAAAKKNEKAQRREQMRQSKSTREQMRHPNRLQAKERANRLERMEGTPRVRRQRGISHKRSRYTSKRCLVHNLHNKVALGKRVALVDSDALDVSRNRSSNRRLHLSHYQQPKIVQREAN